MPAKKRKDRLDFVALFERQGELTLDQPAEVEPEREETQEEIWQRLAALKESFTPARMRRVKGVRRERVATRSVMLTLPYEMHRRMMLIAKLREIPMSHLVEVVAQPVVDELYDDLKRDFGDLI